LCTEDLVDQHLKVSIPCLYRLSLPLIYCSKRFGARTVQPRHRYPNLNRIFLRTTNAHGRETTFRCLNLEDAARRNVRCRARLEIVAITVDRTDPLAAQDVEHLFSRWIAARRSSAGTIRAQRLRDVQCAGSSRNRDVKTPGPFVIRLFGLSYYCCPAIQNSDQSSTPPF